MKTEITKPLNQGKFARKMRERRARRLAAGRPANNKRHEDVTSAAYVRRINEHLIGQAH